MRRRWPLCGSPTPSWAGRVTDFPWLHVVAVVKGTAEGDSMRHFGSLFGFGEYEARTVALGLVRRRPVAEVREDDDELVLTEAGEAFYRDFGLDKLPPGRGYNWLILAPGFIEPAAEQLTRLWAARSTASGPG